MTFPGVPVLSLSLVALLADVPRSVPASQPRTVELTYQAEIAAIPPGARVLKVWLPVPKTDASQTIHRTAFDAPAILHPEVKREPRDGNEMRSMELLNPPPRLTVSLRIEATRREVTARPAELTPAERQRYLAAEPLVPTDGPIHAMAVEATKNCRSDAEKARAIYDKVTSLVTYDKSGTGWGRGDALFACTERRGNCTDFHALLIGMARSIGLPARFVMGLPLPHDPPSGQIPGYHCWAELYVADRGWVPVDSSEAAQHPARRDFYFGHLDPNRLEFSRGRQVLLSPPQQGPPLNFFIYPYAEVDGKPHTAITHRLSYKNQ